MPQLDLTFYISNVFWFLVSFSLIYTSISLFASKKIEVSIKERANNLLNLSEKINYCKTKSEEIIALIEKVKEDKKFQINALQKHTSSVLYEKRAQIESELSDYYEKTFDKSKLFIYDFKSKISSQEDDLSLIVKSKYVDILKLSTINEKRS